VSAVPLTLTDATGGNTRHAIGVHIVLVDEAGRVLFGRRAQGLRLAGGQWSTPCGNLEVEPAPSGAAREAYEELGIVIDPGELTFAHLIHFVNQEGYGPAFAAFFIARAWTGTPRICEPDKCEQLAWHALDDLPQPIVPYVASALGHISAALAATPSEPAFSLHGWPGAASAIAIS
jgi:8-oxo-dGTP pyrophosphatase MutT (NUDIX family)